MTYRLILFFVLTSLFPFRSGAAMVRVVEIQEGPTMIVERDGVREPIRLAGVTITNEPSARELLRWTIDGAWLKIEPAAEGGHLIWRSPDALFLNRELVLRGFATATMPGIEPEPRAIVTYLGTIDPIGTPAAAKPSPDSKVKAAESPKKRSGTSRRSSKPPSRKARSRPSAKSG